MDRIAKVFPTRILAATPKIIFTQAKKTWNISLSNGIKLFRIPFRWERIQPQLGQPLDQEELKRLQAAASDAATLGAYVILDLHNYARFRTKKDGKAAVHVVGDKSLASKPTVTVNDLCNLWQRLALEFRHHPGVVGYGIMNEPHDMPDTGWRHGTQFPEPWLTRFVRLIQRPRYLLLAIVGRCARFFSQANGPIPWIDPNVPNIVYEAHLYFDENGSGEYPLAYEKLLQKKPQAIPKRLRICFNHFSIGVLATKCKDSSESLEIPSDPGWLQVMDDFLSTIQTANVGGCYWAAGPWWGDYPLSIQPEQKTPKLKPQMKILKRYMADERKQ